MQSVDINCDMGEGFGRWRIGDVSDDVLMGLITSANIAAGFHAGDPTIIEHTVQQAVAHGVGIGAHPGYNDLQGFGRRTVCGSIEELVNDIVYQVGAVQGFAQRHGATLRHVKPHGAIYMDMAKDTEFSKRFIDYMRSALPDAFVFCMGGSATEDAARAAGHPVVREFFADRDYDDTGSIVFVRKVGQFDPLRLADKCLRACFDGKVETVTGALIDIEFESICVHSDTPGAANILQAVRDALTADGIAIRAVSETE